MFDGSVPMEHSVKMDLAEVAEFEVYLDIDGVVEEEENESIPPASGREPAQPLHLGGKTVAGVPLQADVLMAGHRRSHISSDVQEDVGPVASTSAHSQHVDKSDEDEIDIDTPYDGKLMGQSQPKIEPTQTSLLSQLLSIARKSNSLLGVAETTTASKKNVAKKSGTLQNSKLTVTKNVAVKSTTPRMTSTKTASNVAIKSTTKQSRPAANRAGSMLVMPKRNNDNELQEMFRPGKSRLKSVHKVLSSSDDRNMPGMSAVSVSGKPSPGNLSKSQTPKRIFSCNEKSGDSIACPECNIIVKQLSLRGHLKNKHSLSMHICKRCKLAFTDVNLYSEHYALHLQQDEDRSAGIHISPMQLHVAPMSGETAVPVQHQLPPKPKKQLAVKREPSPTIANRPSFSILSRDIPSSKMTFPGQLKPGKSSSPKKKQPLLSHAKGSSSSFGRLSSSLPGTSGITFPVQPKLPPKPPKPFPSKKRRSSPASVSRHSLSPGSISSESRRARRTSTASLQSESSPSSDQAEVIRPNSIHYRENQKAAFRRGQRSSSPTDIPPTKKQRLGKDCPVAASKKLYTKEVYSEREVGR